MNIKSIFPGLTVFFIVVVLLSACSLIKEEPLRIPSNVDSPQQLSLELLVDTGLNITFLTDAGDRSGRLFLTTRTGQVRIIDGDRLLSKPFLDITEKIDSASIEQGLLSVAFDPDYENNGIFYVYYINKETDNDTVVARYRVSSDPNKADEASEEIVLFLEQPANNHNGGQLHFGPDNMLYIGLGDGGRGNDPWGHGQNAVSLFGSILRIDVRGELTYSVPDDNPFVGSNEGANEVWVYGLRNPWRFSFDRATGNLYIGDVGQNLYEELNFMPGGTASGANFGWNVMEGLHCFRPETGCSQTGLELPIFEYQHGEDGCSISGGYVYRGDEFPSMFGHYYFGDYCSGKIWRAQQVTRGEWLVEEIFDSELQIVSFGEDENGELYVLDFNGLVFRLIETP